jgi:hypothetical protein
VCFFASTLAAQQPVRLAEASAFVREPGGTRLAELSAGASIRPGRTRGDWVEVRLEGWIWTASTGRTTRDGFDLVVTATGGENLRAAPDGPLIARAEQGALFDRVGTRGGWTQVRRVGWVARASLPRPRPAAAATGLGAGTGGGTGSRAAAPAPAPPRATAVADSQATRDTVPRAVPAPAPAAAERREWRATLRTGTTLHRNPDGEGIAEIRGTADVVVGASDRDWVPVRLEGWVRSSDLAGSPPPPPAITAAQVRDQPDRFVGDTVAWRLQFLAHQRADELRPEMPPGQHYLLTRGPLPETGFVYLMVSRAQASSFARLEPLDLLEATVVIRAGRTRYLATPVVELVRVTGR